MDADDSLPRAFAAARDTNKFLAGARKRAAKNFRLTRRESLENATRLAYCLFVFLLLSLLAVPAVRRLPRVPLAPALTEGR